MVLISYSHMLYKKLQGKKKKEKEREYQKNICRELNHIVFQLLAKAFLYFLLFFVYETSYCCELACLCQMLVFLEEVLQLWPKTDSHDIRQ